MKAFKIFILAFWGLLCANPVLARDDAGYQEAVKQCQKLRQEMPLNVIIGYDYGTFGINERNTTEALTRFACKRQQEDGGRYNERHGDVCGVGSSVGGFTRASFGHNASYTLKNKVSSVGEYNCLFIDTIDLDFSSKKSVIYLAKNYKDDPCMYRHILRHELQHLEISRISFGLMLRNLKLKLEKNIGSKISVVSRGEDISAKFSKFNNLVREVVFKNQEKWKNNETDNSLQLDRYDPNPWTFCKKH